MRKNPTASEELLWEHLRNRRLQGFKFRRQHPIGRFLADFCCPAQNLVIELDGGFHRERTLEDQHREIFLKNMGFKVIRFSNEEVLHSIETVLEVIGHSLGDQESSSVK